MATIYKRKDSPYYWCCWKRPDGTRARAATGCPVAPSGSKTKDIRLYEDSAQLKAHKLEAEDWQGFNPHQAPKAREDRHYFDELMLMFIEERQPGRSDRGCMKHLYRHFSGFRLNGDGQQEGDGSHPLLDAKAVTKYKSVRAKAECRGRKTSPATIRRELATLSSAINYARFEWDWPISNPVEGRRPKSSKPRIIWATPEEAARMIEAAKQNDYAPYLVDFVELGLNTGMRKMEMLGCELKRVDLNNGVIHLNPHNQKNGQYGSVPLNVSATKVILRRLEYIKEHCPKTPWLFPIVGKGHTGDKHLGDIRKGFTRMCNDAGMPHFFPHALRHTYCSWLLQAGVPIYTVKDCMRHASITQTEEYGHLAPKNREDSVAKLDNVLSRICHVEEKTEKQGSSA